MSRALTVLLNGEPAGVLERSAGGALRLRYEEAWRLAPGAYPLSLQLPLATVTHGGAGLRHYLEGLLPDSRDLRDAWGREFGVTGDDTFGLLTRLGEDCAGAVQFVRPDRLAAVTGDAPEAIEWRTEAEIAARLRLLRSPGPLDLGAIRLGRFSLAGMQRKLALLHREGRWGDPRGRAPSTHILKLPRMRGHAENEHLCLALAQEAGIVAARSRVQIFEDQQVLVVERYDRLPGSGKGTLLRVHQEDCCQALGRAPDDKYEQQGGPGARAIADLLWLHSTAKRADVVRLLEALALNWILVGADAHAKNYAVLLTGAETRLAPLYDVASAAAMREVRRPAAARLPMQIGGAYRVANIRGTEWRALARALRLDPEEGLACVHSVARRVHDALPAVYERASTDPVLWGTQVTRFAKAIDTRVGDCVTLLKR